MVVVVNYDQLGAYFLVGGELSAAGGYVRWESAVR